MFRRFEERRSKDKEPLPGASGLITLYSGRDLRVHSFLYHMALINTMEQLKIAHMEVREVVESIKTKVENVSNVDGLSIDADGERQLIEQTISGLAMMSANQLAGLKTRLNTLVPINRLPVEIFAYIILLTNTPMKEDFCPSAITGEQCSFRILLFGQSSNIGVRELLRRSKSAKLTVLLSYPSRHFISTLETLFAEESDRICGMKLLNDNEELIQLVLSGRRFPSLRRLLITEQTYFRKSEIPFTLLAPAFVASSCLETLQCSLGGDVAFDQLAPILTRIRNLSLFISDDFAVVPPLFEILDNSAKLHVLRLHTRFGNNHPEVGSRRQVILPNLQFLSTSSSSVMEFFGAPNLISVNSAWRSGLVPLALEEFNFLRIRYLCIRDPRSQKQCNAEGMCVLGAKERIACRSLFSQTAEIFYDDPPIHESSSDCFHFDLGYRGTTFSAVFQGMSMILPRLTSLVELYLLIPHTLEEFDALLSHTPSVEELVVKRGNKLLDVIRILSKKPPPCPHLKYPYFKTFSVPRNIEKYANDVGKSLTKCLQSRQKESVDRLGHIILDNCPPLPDIWLAKLQDLGQPEVVTEKDVKHLPIMASINTMEELKVAHMEIRKVVRNIKTKIANASNVHDSSVGVEEERELIHQTIGDLVMVSANQLAGLKTRLNALVPINRLPVEIFAHIILLTNTSTKENSHPYIRYSWVCHHWRSALIQNSAFWTVIQHRSAWYSHDPQSIKSIYEELLWRSKSAKLDVRLSDHSIAFISTLEKVFAEESVRICGLRITGDHKDLIQLVLSGKQFPSLQRLSLPYGGTLVRLVSVLVASDHLETLECAVWDNTSFNHLAPILHRIQNLNIDLANLSLVPGLFDLLQDSTKLQTLQLRIRGLSISEAGPRQIILPELRFLSVGCFSILNLIRAPKLLSLEATWNPRTVPFAPQEFDFPPIEYLYIRGSQNHRGCAAYGYCFLGVDRISQEYPRDCFHLDYSNEFGRTLGVVLQEISLVLPRLTRLVEVYFLIPHSLDEFEVLITHLPSIEKLVVQRGNKLLDVIRLFNKSPSLCPRLKHLYFKTFVLPKNLQKYANDVGKSLTKCLESRRKSSADDLKYLNLKNCPPLPSNWLKKLENLGITTVVTESSAKNVIVGNLKEEKLHKRFAISDIEIDTV
ncbi:hypothetical protein Clacol_006880 [Clathrus columnatus]|uniref:F-box domain-containing protein n=1 Tax=Clathrus columnatus TaxID=1419009 RepID=A0AAV5AFX5_9AGAM|nr:hypothetical protein Clacol_006880 [Clathrus columnatus]